MSAPGRAKYGPDQYRAYIQSRSGVQSETGTGKHRDASIRRTVVHRERSHEGPAPKRWIARRVPFVLNADNYFEWKNQVLRR